MTERQRDDDAAEFRNVYKRTTSDRSEKTVDFTPIRMPTSKPIHKKPIRINTIPRPLGYPSRSYTRKWKVQSIANENPMFRTQPTDSKHYPPTLNDWQSKHLRYFSISYPLNAVIALALSARPRHRRQTLLTQLGPSGIPRRIFTNPARNG